MCRDIGIGITFIVAFLLPHPSLPPTASIYCSTFHLFPPPCFSLIQHLLTGPEGQTLRAFVKPCLNPSIRLRTCSTSWSALLRLASVPSNEACLGVNGFGYFPRKESHSAAGPRPSNTENYLDICVDTHIVESSTAQRFVRKKKMDSRLKVSGMTM